MRVNLNLSGDNSSWRITRNFSIVPTMYIIGNEYKNSYPSQLIYVVAELISKNSTPSLLMSSPSIMNVPPSDLENSAQISLSIYLIFHESTTPEIYLQYLKNHFRTIKQTSPVSDASLLIPLSSHEFLFSFLHHLCFVVSRSKVLQPRHNLLP